MPGHFNLLINAWNTLSWLSPRTLFVSHEGEAGIVGEALSDAPYLLGHMIIVDQCITFVWIFIIIWAHAELRLAYSSATILTFVHFSTLGSVLAQHKEEMIIFTFAINL